jgi:glyoxylase-like metal-dependent hydrolase (beta-lactamase superfamily II)
MQIGNYKLHSVQTGLFRLDGGAMFGVVPKVLWSRTNPADDMNRIDMCMRALLLVSDKKKILVDDGIGDKSSKKFNEIYGVDHSTYSTERSLKEIGLTSSDITDVILTHLHFDHCGGSTYRDDEGKIKPVFPNAVYYVQKKQFEWASNPSEKDKASFLTENFLPLQEAGRLNLYNDGCKFDESISLHIVNGHTPYQQILTVKDDKTSLLYAADLFPMTTHLNLPYIMGYDLNPLTTLEEKKKYLANAAGENWVLFFEHDPFTETCRLHKTDKGYEMIERMKLAER